MPMKAPQLVCFDLSAGFEETINDHRNVLLPLLGVLDPVLIPLANTRETNEPLHLLDFSIVTRLTLHLSQTVVVIGSELMDVLQGLVDTAQPLLARPSRAQLVSKHQTLLTEPLA
ncbi:hypothetical protein P0R31_05525 [Bradyrhizobium yuanmingense]|uniref:hypothetical protein n=1 Tax=Bradyrhizobium yuanmingense TaxID=108015 RepID=UPI0023B94FE0|nr:hypothetical protein [Bradyrhizobium yuanmingense]MDF0516695.1 hypothetical protein [Bradyrhizobium yuanmingense]